MNFLHALGQLLGAGHPQSLGQAAKSVLPTAVQQAVSQAHPQQAQGAAPQHPLAQGLHQLLYAQRMNADGSGGGLGPNNPSALHVQPNHFGGNLGVPTGNQVQMGQYRQMPQTGDFNPGFTPLQNSGFGPGGNPQARVMPVQNAWQNPQMSPTQQLWQ